jgi:hypothetical protein
MNFLFPAFLLGGLAIAVPIILHLLRRDVAPEVRFSAVRLLKRSPVERSRRRRIRDLLLLAARVTALLLLATAFARPFAPGAALAMLPLRIVAIDRSFSMAAPGAFDRARQLALAAIDEAGVGERVAVIAFDDRATVVAEPGGTGEARKAIGSVAPGYGSTRYGAALTKAAELAGGGAARLVIITDLQRAGWEGETRMRIPDSLEVEVRPVEMTPANAAVVDVRQSDQGLTASVRNASGESRSGTIRVEHAGREAARARYSVGANATVDVPIEWTATKGDVLVSIEDGEGFPADNQRHIALDAPTAAAVLVVTSADASGFYLQRALEAAQGADVMGLNARLVSPSEIAGGRAASVSRHRAVVLLSTRSLDRAAREAISTFVRSGGGLLIAASSDVEPAVVAALFGWDAASLFPAESRRGSFTATDVRHPIFRQFGPFAANLGNVRFTRAWRVDPEGWHVTARFDDGTPALLERPEGEGRVVLFASDLDRRWNDFPLHPTFVPFVTEAVRHVALGSVEGDTFLVGRVPASVSPEPGVHRLESGRVITVNVDPRESSVGVLTEEEFAGMLERVSVATEDRPVGDEQTEARQSLWQYGLLLMLATLVAESFIGKA